MRDAISHLLSENNSSRFFPNFFDAIIKTESDDSSITPNASSINTAYQKIAGRCFSIDFGGDLSLDLEYSDTTKQHFIKKANAIKSVTLGFYESHNLDCIRAFKTDLESIFDFEQNVFLPGNPNRIVKITLDDTTKVNGLEIMGTIFLTGAKIQNYKYPKLSWKDKEPSEVSVTFAFDRLKFDDSFASNVVPTTNKATRSPGTTRTAPAQ